MESLPLVLMACALPAGLGLLWRKRILDPRRDLALFLFLAVVWTYLHGAPLLCAIDERRLAVSYFRATAWVTWVFEPLLIGAYLWVRAVLSVRLISVESDSSPTASEVHIRWVCGAVLLGTFLFLQVALGHGLLTRHLTHEVLAERSLGLSALQLFSYRSYAESALFVLLLLCHLWVSAKTIGASTRKLLRLTLLVHFLALFAYTMVNSRLQLVLLAACGLVAFVASPAEVGANAVPGRSLRLLKWGVAGGLSVLLLLKLIVNFRIDLEYNKRVSLAALNPFGTPRIQVEVEGRPQWVIPSYTPIYWRLNGLDLIARVEPFLDQKGAMLGRAWVRPIRLYLDRFLNPERHELAKREMRTTPKREMLAHFTGDDRVDYFSSGLTDLYGNFGYLGFLLGGVFFGALAALVATGLQGAAPWGFKVAAFYLLPILLSFEKEFISYVLNPIKFSAGPALLLLLSSGRPKWLSRLLSFPKMDRMQWLLIAVFLVNNVLAYFPFPDGRSQNHIKSLSGNLPWILSNLGIFVIALLGSFRDLAKSFRYCWGPTFVMSAYVMWLFFQGVGRTDPYLELLRSGAFALNYLSAIGVAAGFWGSSEEERTEGASRLQRALIFGTMLSVAMGLVVAVYVRGSVSWGQLDPSLDQDVRAEFFFFHVMPNLGVQALVSALVFRPWKASQSALLSGFAALLVGGVLLTRTRSYTLPVLMTMIWAAYLCYGRWRAFRRLVAVLLMVLLGGLLVRSDLASNLSSQVQAFLRIDVSSGREKDWTNSRGELNRYLVWLFQQRPMVGHGAEETRRLIYTSHTAAKSEHGYTVHLASFGIPALLFFLYFGWGLVRGAVAIFRLPGMSEVADPQREALLTSASVAVAGALLGLTGALGSASGINDWLILFLTHYCFLATARGTRRKSSI
jgi:hypothetical protein